MNKVKKRLNNPKKYLLRMSLKFTQHLEYQSLTLYWSGITGMNRATSK